MTHIGGWGTCTGLGSTGRSGIETVAPWWDTRSSVHSRRQEVHVLVPRDLRRVRIDTEAAQLRPGRRARGAELEPSAGEDVEDRRALRHPDRMVHLRNAHDCAVADADPGGLHRHGGEEQLRRRAVRVLLEKVVFDGPHRVEAELVRQPRLLEGVRVHRPLRRPSRRPRDRELEEDPELHGAAWGTGTGTGTVTGTGSAMSRQPFQDHLAEQRWRCAGIVTNRSGPAPALEQVDRAGADLEHTARDAGRRRGAEPHDEGRDQFGRHGRLIARPGRQARSRRPARSR